MAEEKKLPSSAFMTGLIIILLAALALGIMFALIIMNKENLSIEKAKEFERDDTIQFEPNY